MATSQSLSVLSLLPEASVLPSGLKATALTELLWPSRVASSFWRGDIPELEGVVATAGGEGLAIGTEGDGTDRAAMAFEGSQQFPGWRTSHSLRMFSPTARGEGLAIGTKGHGIDQAAMAVEGGQEFLSGHIPELEGVVVTARGEGFAIGTEGDSIDRAAMAVEGGQEFLSWPHPRA